MAGNRSHRSAAATNRAAATRARSKPSTPDRCAASAASGGRLPSTRRRRSCTARGVRRRVRCRRDRHRHIQPTASQPQHPAGHSAGPFTHDGPRVAAAKRVARPSWDCRASSTTCSTAAGWTISTTRPKTSSSTTSAPKPRLRCAPWRFRVLQHAQPRDLGAGAIAAGVEPPRYFERLLFERDPAARGAADRAAPRWTQIDAELADPFYREFRDLRPQAGRQAGRLPHRPPARPQSAHAVPDRTGAA